MQRRSARGFGLAVVAGVVVLSGHQIDAVFGQNHINWCVVDGTLNTKGQGSNRRLGDFIEVGCEFK